MQPNNNATGATEIFRMPSADSTVPDLMGGQRPAKPTLAIVKGPQTGSVFELSTNVITLGREPSNSVFLNDMTVSRHHATIEKTGNGFSIKDENSFNGVWINNENITHAMLKDGSTVQIGTFRMVFHTNRRPMRIETGV